MKKLLILLLALCASLTLTQALAAEPPTAEPLDANPWHDQGDYRVHFSTFNSDFLQPATAKALGLVRAHNQLLVNISLSRKQANGYGLGLKAAVSGSATNLMQQQKSLSFVEVAEPGATYYLAPVRIDNEEVLHFAVEVVASDGSRIPVKFSRKVYVSE